MNQQTGDPVLVASSVSKAFAVRAGAGRKRALLRAVQDVSFDLHAGKTLALVGESGSGKSTTGRLVVGLDEPTTGGVTLDGRPVQRAGRRGLRRRRSLIQMVFQDPYSSLNPALTVRSILEEPLVSGNWGTRREITRRVDELLSQAGMKSTDADRTPNSFSGGQRQRIGILRAIATNPKVVVLDEPVSALDVSVQSQILNLLKSIQEQTGIAYLFITHDLGVVRFIADEVAVMYAGRIVERGSVAAIFADPKHPYTQALISAVPEVEDEREDSRILLTGDPADATQVTAGCPFQPRCWLAVPECSSIEPPLSLVGPGHFAACLLASSSPP